MTILRWLHRWFGIGLGIFIAIAGLTGSWLIYDRELAAPAYQVDSSYKRLPLQQLYERALPHLPPDTNVSIRFPRQADLPYQFLAGETQVVIDQYTGKVLAVREAEFWPYGWMFHLHKELLLGKSGETLGGWIGVGVLLITIAGIVLWWPKKLKNALQLRRNHGKIIFWRDLHKQAGVIAAPFLLLAVVTGVNLSFSEWVRDTANALFGTGKEASVMDVPLTSGIAPVSLDELARRGDEALPGGRIGLMQIPVAPSRPAVIRKWMPGDPHPFGLNFIYLNRVTGDVLQTVPLQVGEPGRRWFNWIYPLHTGEALQPWHHWVLLVIGLLPSVLFVTGVYLYLLRKRKLGRV